MRRCTDGAGGHTAQGSRYKVHNVLDTTHKDFDPNTAAVWEHAEKFDPKTEHMFRYLQVHWQAEEERAMKRWHPVLACVCCAVLFCAASGYDCLLGALHPVEGSKVQETLEQPVSIQAGCC